MNSSGSNGFRWWPTVTFVVAACAAIAVLLGLAAWQEDTSDQKIEEAEAHVATVGYLEQSKVEGAEASALLREFVETGDQALIPEIQAHASAGVEQLTQAGTSSGSSGIAEIGSGSLSLVEGLGSIIALRNQGDVEGSVAALTQLQQPFADLTASVDAAIADEEAQAASLVNSADTAEDAAAWLRIAALTIAAVTVLVVAATTIWNLLGRRTARAATP
jgi:hypothetical protein